MEFIYIPLAAIAIYSLWFVNLLWPCIFLLIGYAIATLMDPTVAFYLLVIALVIEVLRSLECCKHTNKYEDDDDNYYSLY
jgi:hypothetical protein